jgi:2'-5' RNA ligase
VGQSSRLYFIALLPPEEIQTEVTQLKQYVADRYGSRAALKSPPHITVQPPFKQSSQIAPQLESRLHQFAQTRAPFDLTLSGFGAFAPRVIYLNISKPPQLLQLHADLSATLAREFEIVDPKAKQRPYAPHMTIASRDLKRGAFKDAWPQFESRSFDREFTATHLTLLRHDGKRWQIEREFLFKLPE